VRLVRLRKNFGQTPALSAGSPIRAIRSSSRSTRNLQNDPATFRGFSRPRRVARRGVGVATATGTILALATPALERANSYLASAACAPRPGCTLKAYRREVIQDVSLYGDMHRSCLCSPSGFAARVTEMEVSTIGGPWRVEVRADADLQGARGPDHAEVHRDFSSRPTTSSAASGS